jgi:hypothetical protein
MSDSGGRRGVGARASAIVSHRTTSIDRSPSAPFEPRAR